MPSMHVNTTRASSIHTNLRYYWSDNHLHQAKLMVLCFREGTGLAHVSFGLFRVLYPGAEWIRRLLR